ncbi:aminopeptidase P family protein, partial [Proteus mirabilis]|nr:aminopeptidase P family protein [Proteus mirabilis]
KEMGVQQNAHIGLSGLEPYPPFYFDGAKPFNTLNGIKEAFPYAQFSSVYRDFFRRASVKCEEELAQVRYAAAIGEAMSEAM